MSRIGNKSIVIPTGVTVTVENDQFTVKGPKGELTKKYPRSLKVEVFNNQVSIVKKGTTKEANMMHGTYRSHFNNMITGVSQGWDKVLEIIGTGYRAEAKGQGLSVNVGYSHPVEFPAIDGITFKVEKTFVTVSGIDKELVGQVAADIRKARPPEPYKGKGIRYKEEYVRRKAGKAAKSAGA